MSALKTGGGGGERGDGEGEREPGRGIWEGVMGARSVESDVRCFWGGGCFNLGSVFFVVVVDILRTGGIFNFVGECVFVPAVAFVDFATALVGAVTPGETGGSPAGTSTT
jgi:hypothetical protein